MVKKKIKGNCTKPELVALKARQSDFGISLKQVRSA